MKGLEKLMKKRKKVIVTILSIIYSTFLIVGNSFIKTNSFKYIEKNIFLNIVTYFIYIIIFYYLISTAFNIIDNKKIKIPKMKGIKKIHLYELFNKNTFLFSLIFIIICWLPYIISFYPIILSPDPSFQIRQYFKIPNKYSTYSIMIDPNVTITNHHPVVHTLLLGTCMKFGTIINNVNIGLFIYSIIQILILSSTLAYTIKFLKEKNISHIYLFMMLLVYSLVPVFPFYSMSAVKDVIFGSLIINYIIRMYKLIKDTDIQVNDYLKTIVLMILIILFRNNGIHTILLSFPLLLLIKKTYKFKLKILTIFLIIISFNYSYNSIILPYFRITPTSVREKLSIPFQQTARYVKEHSEDVTEEEKQIIDKVLVYDTLGERYKGEIADPVKNQFNKYTTKEELNAYFKVWFNQLLKHPKTYFEATINNTYGYYYPLKNNWYIYYKFDSRITDDGFNYHYNNLELSRNILSIYGNIYQFIPILNIFVNIGINVWILIFMASYLFYRKKYNELIYLSPSFVLLLVCIASPVNTYFRYALPYVFALMLNFGLFLKEVMIDE